MKTVSDFLGQLWLRFLKPNGPITIPHQTEGKAKRFSDNNSILQKSLETFLQKNAAKDRKRAKYGDRSLKKAFR